MYDLETIACPLCGGSQSTVVYPGAWPSEVTEEFLAKVYRSSSDQTLFEQLVRCNECGLGYLNPRLPAERIIQSYATGEDPVFVEQDPLRVRTFRKVFQRFAKQEKIPLTKTTNVLDVGCAGGAFVQAASELGVTAIGIEPNVWMSAHARSKGLDVRSGTVEDHAFADGEFDVTTMWDVIEHLSSPKDVLKELHRITKPGGRLLVNYPDFGSLPAKLLGRKWPFLLSVHLVYYTPKTIRRQLEQAGFHVLRIERHWQMLELGYVLQRASAYFGIFRPLGKLAERLKLHTLPITYWIGQTRVIAER